jgi:histidine decarboxylase
MGTLGRLARNLSFSAGCFLSEGWCAMISRRRFLSQTAIGMMAVASGCQPPRPIRLGDQPESSRLSLRTSPNAVRQTDERTRLLGYPINMAMPTAEFFDWRESLGREGIGRFAYNNVGDPFRPSSIAYNTHDYEREVIRHFGDHFGFSRDDLWGFLSNSGTDSNLHGMYIGRTLLRARHGVLPKAYYTREAHYSIQILQDLLGLDAVIVGTAADGSMDPVDLARNLDAHSSHPALVVATIGTTFKGAIDPLDLIRSVTRGRACYVHLDAALFGGYLSYTQHSGALKFCDSNRAEPARYESIAVSCHKFFGFPAPAGLFLTTSATFEEFRSLFQKVHDPSYIHHVPGTITCSRDAVKPAEFLYFTTETATRRLVADAESMLRETTWLYDQMRGNFAHLQPVRENDLSNTVYFSRPSDALVRKYSLATCSVGTGKNRRPCAHVVVMPHASRRVLTDFLTDLESDGRTPGGRRTSERQMGR